MMERTFTLISGYRTDSLSVSVGEKAPEPKKSVSAAQLRQIEGAHKDSKGLDGRYDELESGRVQLIPGDEAFARLRAKSVARRGQRY